MISHRFSTVFGDSSRRRQDVHDDLELKFYLSIGSKSNGSPVVFKGGDKMHTMDLDMDMNMDVDLDMHMDMNMDVDIML